MAHAGDPRRLGRRRRQRARRRAPDLARGDRTRPHDARRARGALAPSHAAGDRSHRTRHRGARSADRAASSGHTAGRPLDRGAPVTRRLLFATFMCVASLLPLEAAAQTRATATRPLGAAASSDLAAGRRIFDAQCGWCHGTGGAGGTGPDLRRATLRHASNDDTLVQIVRNGIPGTEMPSFAIALTDTMAWQTAAYVRSLGRTRATPVPGNAQRGEQLYDAIGCGSCHVVSGRGGILGPELTAIGALRGAPYLREAIVKPAAAHPPGYLVVRAVAASGAAGRGVRGAEAVFWMCF